MGRGLQDSLHRTQCSQKDKQQVSSEADVYHMKTQLYEQQLLRPEPSKTFSGRSTLLSPLVRTVVHGRNKSRPTSSFITTLESLTMPVREGVFPPAYCSTPHKLEPSRERGQVAIPLNAAEVDTRRQLRASVPDSVERSTADRPSSTVPCSPRPSVEASRQEVGKCSQG